jgi:hypothetical protein
MGADWDLKLGEAEAEAKPKGRRNQLSFITNGIKPHHNEVTESFGLPTSTERPLYVKLWYVGF